MRNIEKMKNILNEKIIKRVLTIILNIIGLTIMYFIQNIRYENIVNLYFDNPKNEVLRSVAFMEANGNDLNSILGISLILLILNIILYRQWINGKRWILEPFGIFIISIILTIFIHINRVDQVKETINTTHNI